MKKLTSILILLAIGACSVWSQTAKEEILADLNKCGGSYYAYTKNFPPQTKAPKGYKPFYISHYSRHGSRYLTKDTSYTRVTDIFNSAHKQHVLTALGEDVYQRLQELMKEASLRAGDLSLVGKRQHSDIAERMFNTFPEVFKGSPFVSLRSTVSLRCNMSMIYFGDKLKQLNPNIQMDYDTGNKFMEYMNYMPPQGKAFKNDVTGPWVEEFRKFKLSHHHPERLMNSLFNDPQFILKHVNPVDLMGDLYSIASDIQDIEYNISFFDLFTTDELYDLWKVSNLKCYIQRANYAEGKGIIPASEKRLLTNILNSANQVIKHGGKVADLRFGHDGNISPLLSLMQINDFAVSVSDFNEVHKYWRNYKVVPMATNLQIIFFRNEKMPDDILVKFLHNESEARIPVKTDMFPFYKWSDVESFYRDILNKI